MMFPSTAWWNYELLFRSRYCILDIILLELVFHFFLVTSSWLEGFASMMSLHSSYYSLSLNCRPLFFGTSLHSSLLVGDYICDISYKSNAVVWLEHFIRNIYTGKLLCINMWSCNYFIQDNIHPYLTETFYMPSISTRTTLRLCTNPICQQRGFILDK